MSENERLATVETEVKLIRVDVSDIKTDVKTLLLRDAARSGGDNRLKGLVPAVALLVSIASAAVVAFGGG